MTQRLQKSSQRQKMRICSYVIPGSELDTCKPSLNTELPFLRIAYRQRVAEQDICRSKVHHFVKDNWELPARTISANRIPENTYGNSAALE